MRSAALSARAAARAAFASSGVPTAASAAACLASATSTRCVRNFSLQRVKEDGGLGMGMEWGASQSRQEALSCGWPIESYVASVARWGLSPRQQHWMQEA